MLTNDVVSFEQPGPDVPVQTALSLHCLNGKQWYEKAFLICPMDLSDLGVHCCSDFSVPIFTEKHLLFKFCTQLRVQHENFLSSNVSSGPVLKSFTSSSSP